MRIASGILTFADSLGLIRTLETLEDGIDQNIVIHTQCPGFHLPGASHSLSDTEKVCSAFQNTIIVDLNQSLEVEARQAYLDLASTFDFLLIIDSDEYIDSGQNDWGLFKENCENIIDDPKQRDFYIYDIAHETIHQPQPVRPKLFKHPSKIKYYLKHYWWVLPNGRLQKGNSDSLYWVKGIRLAHDKALRNKAYADATAKYQQHLMQYESQFVV